MGFFSKIVGSSKGKLKKDSNTNAADSIKPSTAPAGTIGTSFSTFTPPATVAAPPVPPVVNERMPLGYIGNGAGETQMGYGREERERGQENSPYGMGRASLKSPVMRGNGPTASNSSLPKFAPGNREGLSASSSSSIDTADSSAECSTPATTPSTSSPSIVPKDTAGNVVMANNQDLPPPMPHRSSRRPNASPLSSAVDPNGQILRKSQSSSNLMHRGYHNGSQVSLHNNMNGMQGYPPMARPPMRPNSSMANRTYSRQTQHNPYFSDLSSFAPTHEQTVTRDSLFAIDPAGACYNLYPSTPTPDGQPKRASLTPTESYKNHLYRRRVVHPVIAEELCGAPIPPPQQRGGPRPAMDPRRRSFHSVHSVSNHPPMPQNHRSFSQQPPMPHFNPHQQQYHPQPLNPQQRPDHNRRRSGSYGPGPHPHPHPHDQQRLRTPQPRRTRPDGKPVEDMLLGLNMLQILERQERDAEVRKDHSEGREYRKRWDESQGRFGGGLQKAFLEGDFAQGRGMGGYAAAKMVGSRVDLTTEGGDSGVGNEPVPA